MHQGRYTHSQVQQKHSYTDCLSAFQQHRLIITKIRFDGEWSITKYLMDGAEFSRIPLHKTPKSVAGFTNMSQLL